MDLALVLRILSGCDVAKRLPRSSSSVRRKAGLADRSIEGAQTLDRIAMRYEIERRAMATAEAAQRVVTPAATLAARQEHSQSQLQGMWALLERTGALVLPKCQMGEAVQCFFNQWRALLRHPKNCQRHIDNQVAERALHSLAIGRNNWPLLQTKRGGWTGAAMASRFLTARTRGIDPKTYIRDVLLGIGSETDATPHSWQHHFAAEVEDQR